MYNILVGFVSGFVVTLAVQKEDYYMIPVCIIWSLLQLNLQNREKKQIEAKSLEKY